MEREETATQVAAPSVPHQPAQPQDPAAKRPLGLPMLVFGIVEVRRLKRELEALDEFMRQARLRDPGKQAALPRVSRLLDALAADNGRNLLQDAERQELYEFLQNVEKSAPSVHISFASDPSSAFTVKVVTWLRTNVHPAILLQTGLQPTIAAGCVLRTSNKQFNFSLRERLDEQRPLLLQALDAQAAQAAAAIAPAPVVPASVPVPVQVQVAVAAPAQPSAAPAVQAPQPQAAAS